jgi:spermidine export protein MdtI
MLPDIAPIHVLYLAIAIGLEVVANVLMKLSNGFQRKVPAIVAIACALAAFTALSHAIEGIELSVAYGIWGGIGLSATAILGVAMFRERLEPLGWLGLQLIIIGVILLSWL